MHILFALGQDLCNVYPNRPWVMQSMQIVSSYNVNSNQLISILETQPYIHNHHSDVLKYCIVTVNSSM